MSWSIHEQWQCQTCFQHFATRKELRKHIEAFQSRVRHLIVELQKSLAHSSFNLPNDEDHGTDDDETESFLGRPTVYPVKDESDEHKDLLCPHLECKDKPRTLFKSWKNFVRHYTIHVKCHENCAFCDCRISRVRKYVTHLDSCKAKKNQEDNGVISAKKQRIAIQRRKSLLRMAAEELKQQMPADTGTENEEVLTEERSSCDETVSRKRTREMVDADSEELRLPRKQCIAIEDGMDSSVGARSAFGGKDVARVTNVTFSCYIRPV